MGCNCWNFAPILNGSQIFLFLFFHDSLAHGLSVPWRGTDVKEILRIAWINMSIIGNNLLILREALGLIQSEVSDKTGISREYISKIELGSRSSVSQTLIKSLCDNLKTTEEWLTKNEGWAYSPPSRSAALEFISRQVNKFQQSVIIIVTYIDGAFGSANGFVFIRPSGSISMEGSETRSGYWGKGPMVYEDALNMIKTTNVKVGHIELDKKESENLIHTDLLNVVKRAKYNKKIIDKELKALNPSKYSEMDAAVFNKYPDPHVTRSITDADTQITLSNDEIKQLLEKMTESKTDIQDLMRYMDKKLIKH